MPSSFKIGKIAGIEIGVHWSWLFIFVLVTWSFADGILAAASYGIRAVIQPGGSVRDADVIEAANEHDLAMVFTGIRHFRH